MRTPACFRRCSSHALFLCLSFPQVRRVEFGKGGVPYVATHDGRTIRYPDPDIKVGTVTGAGHVGGEGIR